MPAEIIDVHVQDISPIDDVKQQIIDGLMRPAGEKHMPTMLLYDERGLRLYDDITTEVPEYYLFGAEEEILRNHADDIVRAMHHGEDAVLADEVVLELGAGCVTSFDLIYSRSSVGQEIEITFVLLHTPEGTELTVDSSFPK